MRFEEERAFRKSRESVQGEQQVPTPQAVSQVPSVQSASSQVSGVTGPQVTRPRSSRSVVQPTVSSGTSFGSQVTGSPYKATRSQISPAPGT